MTIHGTSMCTRLLGRNRRKATTARGIEPLRGVVTQCRLIRMEAVENVTSLASRPIGARPSVALFLARRRARQCVVVAFALPPSYGPLVSDRRQLCRSRISPAEHVGKQIDGVAGCRASGRRGGTAGPVDKFGDLPAQAVSSRSSISTRQVTFFQASSAFPCCLRAIRSLSSRSATRPRIRFACVSTMDD